MNLKQIIREENNKIKKYILKESEIFTYYVPIFTTDNSVIDIIKNKFKVNDIECVFIRFFNNSDIVYFVKENNLNKLPDIGLQIPKNIIKTLDPKKFVLEKSEEYENNFKNTKYLFIDIGVNYKNFDNWLLDLFKDKNNEVSKNKKLQENKDKLDNTWEKYKHALDKNNFSYKVKCPECHKLISYNEENPDYDFDKIRDVFHYNENGEKDKKGALGTHEFCENIVIIDLPRLPKLNYSI